MHLLRFGYLTCHGIHIILTDFHGNRATLTRTYGPHSARIQLFTVLHTADQPCALNRPSGHKGCEFAKYHLYIQPRRCFNGRGRSHKCFSSYVQNAVAWLRMAFHVSLEKHPTSVLWIVRKKNSRVRGLRRAAQKIHALQSRWNLQSVDPEELPTRDVIKIFTGAQYVFAPHGGGNV